MKLKRPRINNEIRAAELRVVDDEGKNFGVLAFAKALEIAKEKDLDLIEISPTAQPPVARIMDFGKFLYKEKRKERGAVKSSAESEMRMVRIHLGTSNHDLALKAKKIDEFLKEGSRVKIDLFLRGREKYLDKEFLNERLNRATNLITEQYKVFQDTRKGPRGISKIIEKNK